MNDDFTKNQTTISINSKGHCFEKNNILTIEILGVSLNSLLYLNR